MKQLGGRQSSLWRVIKSKDIDNKMVWSTSQKEMGYYIPREY